MTKDEFVALCTEEGLIRREAELIWDNRPDFKSGKLNGQKVREAARDILPLVKVARQYMDLEC